MEIYPLLYSGNKVKIFQKFLETQKWGTMFSAAIFSMNSVKVFNENVLTCLYIFSICVCIRENKFKRNSVKKVLVLPLSALWAVHG